MGIQHGIGIRNREEYVRQAQWFLPDEGFQYLSVGSLVELQLLVVKGFGIGPAVHGALPQECWAEGEGALRWGGNSWTSTGLP